MNPISGNVMIGTAGELLVQLRLLQHGVQAAAPIKDSGNDLISVKETVFRAIQVKTTTRARYSVHGLPAFYHILAVVHLCVRDSEFHLDQSCIYLIPRQKVEGASRRIDDLGCFRLTHDLIHQLFQAENER